MKTKEEVLREKFKKYIEEGINIIGYVDNYGAVHSTEIEIDNDKSHPEIFPGAYIKRWRWSYSRGFWSVYGKFDIEDTEKIKSHMTKKYGIQWYENGYHNIEYMMEVIK